MNSLNSLNSLLLLPLTARQPKAAERDHTPVVGDTLWDLGSIHVSKSSLACGIAYLYIDILCRRDVLGVLPRGPRVLTLACGRYGPDLAGPLVAPRGCKSQAVQQELSHA